MHFKIGDAKINFPSNLIFSMIFFKKYPCVAYLVKNKITNQIFVE